MSQTPLLQTGLGMAVVLGGSSMMGFVPSIVSTPATIRPAPEVHSSATDASQAGATAAGSSTSFSVVGAAGAAALTLGALATRSHSHGLKVPKTAICAFENEMGVQAPVGFFDPLGFTKDGDEKKFARRRASELKHGRVAMIAAMGYIAPEYFRFPGYCSPSEALTFDNIPNGLAALSKVPVAGGLQIFFWCGFCEWILLKQSRERAPGDFENFGNLGVPYSEGIPDEEKRKRGLNSELANGRLAMVAITGMMFQNGFLGTTGPEMWLPGGAFEGELGVQAPVGFFDPLGLSKDGDADAFYRRRCTEIKHGRVSMIAAMGYIVPEYFRFPGYCSPSEGLKFADIPNGLAAISKLPVGGIAQYIAFCGFLEVYAAQQDPANPPGKLTGNDEGFGPMQFGRLGLPKGDGIADPEAKKRGLNSELANGRLAMVAITGMMFQNGFLGTTGPEMWLPGGAFENEMGVQAPVGFFDPLGFTKDGDEKKFARRRASELKHGRVAMLAAMGYIAPEYFRFPGFCSTSEGLAFTDIPNGLGALSKMPVAGGLQIFFWCGFVECLMMKQSRERAPGDFEIFGNLGVPYAEGIVDEEKRKRGLNSELANGRLAMVAIMGMMFQNGYLGTTGPEMWLPGGAFEGELGVQAPVGFFDPLGLSKDGDADTFYRRRCTEIKHGRVSMIAAMGYIVPEYFRFPGYCSPSEGLKFADIPNGLAAISKLPVGGIAQYVAFCGFLEVYAAQQDPANPPGKLTGNDEGFGPMQFGRLGLPKGDGIADPEAKKRGLNSELANGRLAMVAITGMMFQNGFLGTTGPEMWLPGGAFENEMGVQAPVGFFDPLGFTKDGDENKFARRRASELKHGRVAMLAAMGYIAPEYFRFPGFCSTSEGLAFTDIPNGLGALSKMPVAGGLQIFFWCGFVECIMMKQSRERAPGDFEIFGNLGVPYAEGIVDEEKRKRGLNSELANGRLAMVAITGMMFQNGYLGTTGPEMWLPGGAFEGELGVQAPVGFFDPLGLSKDGDADTFYRRRCTEIKHGRVSMIAAMGYIVPEYVKFPGYCSPSEGLKFADIPNGLAALSKMPVGGIAQYIAFCGFLEVYAAQQDPSNPPGKLTGNDEGFGPMQFGRLGIPKGDGIADPEAKKRGLNSELANGRLAMVAVTGMMFQNGFLGTTGPEMWLPGNASRP